MNPKKKTDEIKRQPKNTKIEGYDVAVKVLNGDLEYALKIYKKVLKDSGKLETFKSYEEFVPKSISKRIMKQDAIRREQRERRLRGD